MIPEEISLQDEIQALFDCQSEGQASLELTTSYRGTILRQQIKPVAFDHQRAVFMALDPCTCAGLEGCVHLHSTCLSKPVKARVKDLSPSSGMFSLSNFSYVEREWKERLHERVQTKEPTYVTMRYKENKYRASLLDISLSGIGLLVGISGDPEVDFHPNCSVCIDLQTSPSYKWEKLGGAIHYQQKTSRLIVRLGIRLYPKPEQAHQLKRYIESRLREIREELDQVANNMKISSGVEYQYF
ncbi:MAG: PilZ domain-containing protein [Anaerolineales bacterium]|jgi:hypothetical protein